MESRKLIIQNAITRLIHQINSCVALSEQDRSATIARVQSVDVALLEQLSSHSARPLTVTNLLYIICFLAGLETSLIASIFAIEMATVYSVRYRLRAYFNKCMILPF